MSKDIPNVSYFIQTNPYNYSASDYFRTFKDLHSSQKDILHGYWVKAIKTLQSCSEPVYIENGKRLIKIWKSPGNGLSEFWENQDQQESALDDLHAATKTARKRTFKSVQRHFGRAFNALDKNTSYEPSTFNESPEGPRPKREVKPVYYAEEDSMEDDSASQYSEDQATVFDLSQKFLANLRPCLPPLRPLPPPLPPPNPNLVPKKAEKKHQAHSFKNHGRV
ncbi:hypothetical protein BGX20_000810 [Mortierella sp. AD010]|nr:hypothetical protein BGX20_000810 [Mortierella sp. AD010]